MPTRGIIGWLLPSLSQLRLPLGDGLVSPAVCLVVYQVVGGGGGGGVVRFSVFFFG